MLFPSQSDTSALNPYFTLSLQELINAHEQTCDRLRLAVSQVDEFAIRSLDDELALLRETIAEFHPQSLADRMLLVEFDRKYGRDQFADDDETEG